MRLFVSSQRKFVSSGGLFYWPSANFPFGGATATLDAATEKCAMIGKLYIAGRPTAAKTLSTGNIQYRASTTTFANGATTVDIGIQDVATGAGPIAQPDGTFDVHTTLTGGGGGITTAAWNTATMNSGSKSMTHGDLIAVVWDMTARGGADSLLIQTGNNALRSAGAGGSGGSGFPTTNAFAAGAWQTIATVGAGYVPNVLITFDDGTLGWIDGGIIGSVFSQDTYSNATNPDERGLVFQVPFDCQIDALYAWGGLTDLNSDFDIKLYANPTGVPVVLASQSILAEQLGIAAANCFQVFNLAAEIPLSANTDYAVTIRATGTANVRLMNLTLANTAHRTQFAGGSTYAKVTRDNDTGAFTAESPAVTMYGTGVRISQIKV